MALFDANRGYLAEMAFPGQGVFRVFGTRLVFHNGYATAMGHNDDRENQLIRYGFSWTKESATN